MQSPPPFPQDARIWEHTQAQHNGPPVHGFEVLGRALPETGVHGEECLLPMGCRVRSRRVASAQTDVGGRHNETLLMVWS